LPKDFKATNMQIKGTAIQAVDDNESLERASESESCDIDEA